MNHFGGPIDFMFDIRTYLDNAAKLRPIMQKLIEEYSLAEEKLTKEQFAQALSEAVASGDFIKYVRVTDNAQLVIYIPFARELELIDRINEPETELEVLKSMS